MWAWRVATADEVLTRVRQAAGETPGRTPVAAVDGRSSGGKTTFASRLADSWPGAAIVHTDDIAWCQAVLDWDYLLADGILRPVREGKAVAYRPPQWEARDRPGAIEVPEDCTLLIVEGVGAGRRELAPLLDAVIWVESPVEDVESRNLVRVDAGETTPEDYELWMAEERPFVAEQRTWERAAFVVAGWPAIPHNETCEFVIAT